MGKRLGWLSLPLFLACSADEKTSGAEVTYATPWGGAEMHTDGPEAIRPLPDKIDLDERKVALGRRLYQDRRLSIDGKVSCNDCHSLSKGGANGEPRSTLPNRDPVGVNVPSTFNGAFNFRFAWSGKFSDIAQQIDAAMTIKDAMGSSWEHGVNAIKGDAQYQRDFREIYPEGLGDASLRDAVAVYCLSLITPGARFDRYLQGQATLEPNEKRGYDMFVDYGCISCHQGVNIGGNMYQRFGVMKDYFADHGKLTKHDLGLYGATGDAMDKHVFRVPSLRNVALTAPYFHDASAKTLEEAVATMAEYQLGIELTPEQASDIAAFLGTLTGESPEGSP